MKHVSFVSLGLTIIVAVIVGLFIANTNKLHRIEQLLQSPSVTDQLEAMRQLEGASFDQLYSFLSTIVSEKSEASETAQRMIVKQAFAEDRLEDLQGFPIDEDLYASAMWWNSHDQSSSTDDEHQYLQLVDDTTASPWIRRLASLHCKRVPESVQEELINMPLRDRDGSVLLAVLAIERHIPEDRVQSLIQSWSNALDLERQSVAILLAALSGKHIPDIHSKNEIITTLRLICSERDAPLAWRASHAKNGMMHPDIVLAALIVDQKRFLPVLIETALHQKWTHPEHPVELARHFEASVATQIPTTLLNDDESRAKWWSLFTCGLLTEER